MFQQKTIFDAEHHNSFKWGPKVHITTLGFKIKLIMGTCVSKVC